MLRAIVSLSRKISRDYNSTGYTVSLDGEIPFTPDESEAVQEKVSELFHLAEEALAIEIDRDQGTDAIGRRDQEPRRPQNDRPSTPAPSTRSNGNAQQQPNGNGDAATNKQCQYLLTLAKRSNLSNRDTDAKIAEIIGRPAGVYQLSKKEAGLVIDALSKNGQTANSNNRR